MNSKELFLAKKTPYKPRMGWCTVISNTNICPVCQKQVGGLHQPFQFNHEFLVCQDCFDETKKAGDPYETKVVPTKISFQKQK